MRPTRLVMLGYFGFGTAGDEAVLAAEVAALRAAAGGPVEFVVISGDPEHTGRTHGLPAVSRTDLPAILRALRGATALVAGGGSLLQDVTSARPVAFYAGVMLAARMLGRPVFCYAQGLGPIRRPANRRIAARALRAATYVSLRDPESVALAGAMGVREVELVPDPVLGLELEPKRGGDDAHLAIALRPWHGQDHWLPPVLRAIGEVAGDVEPVFVPFHAEQDIELARAAADACGSAARVVEPDGGHLTVVEAIAGSRAVLGMRLHALVVAAAAARPGVALSYDPKVTAFAEQVGQPVAATLPGPVDADELTGLIRVALRGERAPVTSEGGSAGTAHPADHLRARALHPAHVIMDLVGRIGERSRGRA